MYAEEDEEPYRNPALISSLWAEWVVIVCDREKIPRPNTNEWAALKARFHYDKAPIDSVAELKNMRKVP